MRALVLSEVAIEESPLLSYLSRSVSKTSLGRRQLLLLLAIPTSLRKLRDVPQLLGVEAAGAPLELLGRAS